MRQSDIAVIGLACRFPAAADPRAFWRLLQDGHEMVGSLQSAADFDAGFFNVSPREAAAMDPRQRLALELTWELFEDAFLLPRGLRGEPISVYVGAMTDDYALVALRQGFHVDHHAFGGLSRGMIANRMSYFYDLRGPSLTVDSGQSSSLLAVHMAVEALRAGTASMAIAGGIHLNLDTESELLEREFGATSPSGHTYAFDERADGYVRSDGGALVLLKPLRAALDDGNRIHAIVSGSAVGNAGGDTSGLTVPSSAAQVHVIRRALTDAGLVHTQVDYVEAHGTGTQVGDPVEATSLGEVFGAARRRPLLIGSVKTNIGHTGAASGIAGLIKTVLAVENRALPASLNFAVPATDLVGLGLCVNTVLTPWTDDVRRAGVSSFGMGGTNVHVVVEQAPGVEMVAAEPVHDVAVPWVLSARSAEALTGQARRLSERVAALGMADTGWSLATTRTVFDYRAVVVGADRGRMTEGLGGLAAGVPGPAVQTGRARPLGKKVFVFPGQGSQYLGMGRGLYHRFPVFAAAFDQTVAVLEPYLRLPLRQVIWGHDVALQESTEFAQPGLFAVQVALAALLRSCGVRADFVVGHSVGEIAAAYEAGVLSLPEAAQLVAERGRLMATLPPGGVMVAVAVSESEVAPLLSSQVSLAAVNAPDSVVLSGPSDQVAAVTQELSKRGRRVHRLNVSHAFHSALMEPIVDDFAERLADLAPQQPRIPLVSNVTGRLAGPGYGSSEYWTEHVRRPVRFGEAISTVVSLGAEVFIEVGPGAGLTAEQEISIVTLSQDAPEADAVLSAMARLFSEGADIDWAATFTGLDCRYEELPTYAFVRQRFWGLSGDEVSAEPEPPAAVGLQHLGPVERRRRLIDLVCFHAAAVLGHTRRRDVSADRAFQDSGFTSMSGVELRNRLRSEAALAGLSLPRTLIFDYPTPADLADHLAELLSCIDSEYPENEDIWLALRNIPIAELRRTGLLEKLQLLAGQSEKASSEVSNSDDVIDSLSPEALIAMTLDSDEEIG
ncbi:type I polyketide synthase [Mycobacterium vicinigordonae]|uniref:Type I polyketide synthase n=1 Tax=Mycobacterium vicinigordonae TaxID=1719132 RepID=A0A7D6E9C8_9MYCO|nr:type I polyketide synthase [Mycobacterium vicinigordonae]QLL10202.1 type I polyketide synthase [Mycobacterium vicinigordonae]